MKLRKRIAAIIAAVTMFIGTADSVQAGKITKSQTLSDQKTIQLQLKNGSKDYSEKLTFKNVMTGRKKTIKTDVTVVSCTLGAGWYETTICGLGYSGNVVSKKKTYVALSPKVTLSMGSNTNIVVNWNKVAGSSGYCVYMSSDNGSSYRRVATIRNANQTTFATGKLTKYKNYYFYIRAFKKAGSKTYMSSVPVKRPGGKIVSEYFYR